MAEPVMGVIGAIGEGDRGAGRPRVQVCRGAVGATPERPQTWRATCVVVGQTVVEKRTLRRRTGRARADALQSVGRPLVDGRRHHIASAGRIMMLAISASTCSCSRRRCEAALTPSMR